MPLAHSTERDSVRVSDRFRRRMATQIVAASQQWIGSTQMIDRGVLPSSLVGVQTRSDEVGGVMLGFRFLREACCGLSDFNAQGCRLGNTVISVVRDDRTATRRLQGPLYRRVSASEHTDVKIF